MNELKQFSQKHGSAMVIALGLGVVLMLIVAALHKFSSHRIHATTIEAKHLMALGVAEAGLNLVQTELRNNYNFKTHLINADLSWGAATDSSQTLKDEAFLGFSIDTKNSGTYSGKLGEKDYGTFKVRCGLIPYPDDPRTQNIDESQCFYRVESLGRIDDISIRRVNAIVQRRFPGREFLMFDNAFLSIIFGLVGQNNVNIFSGGHLYGHKGVEIGQILLKFHNNVSPGTKQAFTDMELISSGLGGIFFYNPTDVGFRADKEGNRPAFSTQVPKNYSFPLNGTYPKGCEKTGENPVEMENQNPAIPDDVASYVRDSKHNANRLTITDPPWPEYKKSAQSSGCYLDVNTTQYELPAGFSPRQSVSGKDDVRVLDFGNQISPCTSTDPWVNPPKGVIYSPKSLVIKGNPPKDLIIVSDQTIYISGDFNQKGDPTKDSDKYGFPQNFGDTVGKDPKTVDNYSSELEKRLTDDAKPTTTNKVHQAVSVLARERIVYDYRSPVDCFENELYPYLQYQLASAVANQNSAYNSFMKVGGAKLVVSSAGSRGDLKNNLISFFNKFPLGDSQKETDLAEDFALAFDQSSSFNEATMNQLSKKAWNSYKQQYSSKKLDPSFGVYPLLNKLRNDSEANLNKDDYLYFPEMTTNGMFISGAMRNQKFYAGPDEARWYDEIGNYSTSVGLAHSPGQTFIHRMFGSEVRLSQTPVGSITQNVYMPPLRRKIYDYSLPRTRLADDLSTFVILSWKDTKALKSEFDSF